MTIRKMYSRFSPFAAREEERRRVLRRFQLHEAHEQGRHPIIDQITQLAKALFGVDSVLVNVGTCTLWSHSKDAQITILTAPAAYQTVAEKGTYFVASTGWTDDASARVEYDIDASICPHAMSKPADAGAFQIPDTSLEWRFRRNPLALAERPIRFFASASTYLPG